MPSPLEDSLHQEQTKYNDLCINIGHLTLQNIHNLKVLEDLKSQAPVVVKKIQSLQANQPKPTPAPQPEEKVQDDFETIKNT